MNPMTSPFEDNFPLVSIIMPVYNGGKFIGEAIQSVLTQTYQNWELLIIDDGSTDDTESVIMARSDIRIQYIKQQHKGVSAARNMGLNLMVGDFFCFLDADDIYPPNSLKSRLEIYSQGPKDLDFVDGRVEERDIELGSILRTYRPSFVGNPMKPMLALSESCYLGQTWMVRRNSSRVYAMRSGLTNGEDFLFLLELARYGGMYAFTEETILIYRRHISSASANLDGLNKGYLFIYNEIRSWDEVPKLESLVFWLKSRKIMFLSYLFNGKSMAKAFRSLFQMQ